MTGPEHYRKAEQLLATVQGTGMGDEMSRDRLAAAQGHATLALAAANVVAFALDAASTDLDDWATLTLSSVQNTELKLRGAVAVSAPEQPNTELEALREAIRAIHYEVDGSPDSEGSCIADCQDYPCATLRALYTEGGA